MNSRVRGVKALWCQERCRLPTLCSLFPAEIAMQQGTRQGLSGAGGLVEMIHARPRLTVAAKHERGKTDRLTEPVLQRPNRPVVTHDANSLGRRETAPSGNQSNGQGAHK